MCPDWAERFRPATDITRTRKIHKQEKNEKENRIILTSRIGKVDDTKSSG